MGETIAIVVTVLLHCDDVGSDDDIDELRILLKPTGAHRSFHGCGGSGREGTFAVVYSDVSMPNKARQHPRLRAQAGSG